MPPAWPHPASDSAHTAAATDADTRAQRHAIDHAKRGADIGADIGTISATLDLYISLATHAPPQSAFHAPLGHIYCWPLTRQPSRPFTRRWDGHRWLCLLRAGLARCRVGFSRDEHQRQRRPLAHCRTHVCADGCANRGPDELADGRADDHANSHANCLDEPGANFRRQLQAPTAGANFRRQLQAPTPSANNNLNNNSNNEPRRRRTNDAHPLPTHGLSPCALKDSAAHRRPFAPSIARCSTPPRPRATRAIRLSSDAGGDSGGDASRFRCSSGFYLLTYLFS
jgi:hypothetical protein